MILFYWFVDFLWFFGKLIVKDIGKTLIMLNWIKLEYDGGVKIEFYVIEMLKIGIEDWVRVVEGVFII